MLSVRPLSAAWHSLRPTWHEKSVSICGGMSSVRPLLSGMELCKTSWHEKSVSPLVMACRLQDHLSVARNSVRSFGHEKSASPLAEASVL